MVYCTDCAFKGLYVFNGSFWQSLLNEKVSLTDVVSPTGQIWMDRNLGATRVATSSTDSEAYGHYYQWGRNSDGHQSITTSGTAVGPVDANYQESNFITVTSEPFDWLTTQDNTRWDGSTKGAHDPCPSGYRVPTETEWEEELQQGGVNGTAINNKADAYASVLRLTAAGRRNYTNGSRSFVGSRGYYWSSSFSGIRAIALDFRSSDANMFNGLRAYGLSVRCIKE
jgi:uncharacterized protein (TIGR02145 family)